MRTEEVAEFICQTQFADIPAAAVDAAKTLIVDFCGVAIAGSREPVSRILSEYLRDVGARSEAGVIGCGFKSEPSLASLVNGTSAHALDYDDHSIKGNIHPTAAILPAVLALGELHGAPGKAILEAYIIGVEVATKIGVVVGPSQYEAGWHTTATLGTMGATAGASKLLKLDHHKVKASLGIAASLAGGLRQNFGTMTKPLHAGRASQNGVMAATLAQSGFSASDIGLEGEFGFGKVFGCQRDTDLSGVNLKLGTPFFLVSPGVDLKRHPSCGSTLCGIEAALELRSQYPIHPGDVVEVELRTHPMVPEVAVHHEPQTGTQAKFSVQYCVSRALIKGDISLRDFTTEAVMESDVRQLMRKVRFITKEEDRKNKYSTATEVTIRMKDGSTYSKRVDIPKGDVENPLTSEELGRKFRDCTSAVMTAASAEKISRLASGLDQLSDIGEFMGVLTSG